MAGLTSGPIGRSLDGHVVGMTRNRGAFDQAMIAGFLAAGAQVYGHPAPDALDAAAADSWFAEAASACGAPIDILVHNRRDREPCAAERLDFAAWRRTQSYLVDSAFLLSAAFARQRIAAGVGGTILSMVDALSMDVAVGATGTGAAGAALAAMTRGWAVEWAADGIRANILGYALWDEPGDPVNALPRSTTGDLGLTTPIGRIATADDLVAMALYLCSPYAAYVTGTTIAVDGGEGLRHTLGGPPFRAPREELPR